MLIYRMNQSQTSVFWASITGKLLLPWDSVRQYWELHQMEFTPEYLCTYWRPTYHNYKFQELHLIGKNEDHMSSTVRSTFCPGHTTKPWTICEVTITTWARKLPQSILKSDYPVVYENYLVRRPGCHRNLWSSCRYLGDAIELVFFDPSIFLRCNVQF